MVPIERSKEVIEVRRTIRASTYYKWAIWCGVFAGLMGGFYLACRFYLSVNDDLMPLYERSVQGFRDGAMAGFIILIVALCAIICAMTISGALTALKILDADVEADDQDEDFTEEMGSNRPSPQSEQDTLMDSSRPF